MWNDIGTKLTGLAKVICWIGIVLSVISGLMMMVAGPRMILSGLMVMILGSLFSWIGSWVTFSIGAAHNNTVVIAQRLEAMEARQKENEARLQELERRLSEK